MAIDTALPPSPAAGPPHPSRRMPAGLRLLGMPLAIGVTLLILYLWVSSQTLDFNEQQSLNAKHIRTTLLEHIKISLWATFLVILIAVPLGILASRRWFRYGAPVILLVGNLGQAIPAFGLLVLLAVLYEPGFKVALIGLVAASALPVLRNTIVGLQQVDPALIEAGRGMGMTSLGVLVRVELPLAVPAILAALRTTMVLAVGTATIVGEINAGGLGELIFEGIKGSRGIVTMTGALLALCLAFFVDWLGAVAEHYLRPRGV